MAVDRPGVVLRGCGDVAVGTPKEQPVAYATEIAALANQI
jgi:hypothetical protein